MEEIMARTAQYTHHLNVLVSKRTAEWLADVADNEEQSVSEVVRGILVAAQFEDERE
jgi:hypothetical protein